jgi:hypothetical protein
MRIPAGSSTLRVNFRTLIDNDRSTVPTCCWQFIYLLAPARDWGGFDKLDVKVLIPSGWKFASNIGLQRDGDILSGTFDHIPDDALALTIRMLPESLQNRLNIVRHLTWIAVAISLPLLLLATWKAGKRIRRRAGTVPIPLVLASALVWGTATSLAAWFLIVYPVQTPGIPWMQLGSPDSAFPIMDIVWFLTFAGTFVGVWSGILVTWLANKLSTGLPPSTEKRAG